MQMQYVKDGSFGLEIRDSHSLRPQGGRSQFSAGRRRGRAAWRLGLCAAACCVLLRPHSSSTARIAYPLLSPVIFRSNHIRLMLG